MGSLTSIEFEHTFSASHHLPDSEGLTTKKCLSNHGHTYAARVFISAEKLSDDFVVDFGTIKETVDLLDHAQLIWEKDEVWLRFYEDAEVNFMRHVILPYPPTAENLAHYLYDILQEALPLNAYVDEVWLAEGTSPGKINWVKYSEWED